MKQVIVFCGVENSGKTNTMKEFFRFKGKRWPKNRLISRIIDDKTVYAVGANSPQELNKKDKENTPIFVKKIKERICEVLEKCEKESKNGDYVLIIPFTIYKHEGSDELCEESIQEPIEWISEKVKITTVYLRKEGYRWQKLTHEFISKLAPRPHPMRSQEKYELHSEELEVIVKTLAR